MYDIINYQLMACQSLSEHPAVDPLDDPGMQTKTNMADRVCELIGDDSLPQAVAKIQLQGGKATVQAVHKWKHGGEISEPNLKALAAAYGSSPAWIRYGVTVKTLTKAQEAAAELAALQPEILAEAFDFARFRLDKSSNVNQELLKRSIELIEKLRQSNN